ncbi:hypothetical protein HYPSUDRAFT_638326 [Hypholoma sublateritium FD-334 SS-4]|uniref:CMP/dCMP-type deaminase domain-containing protein n=1 Tax=Hypholoma sublateritium (strain FD-334 SS-4) TaxID=945553 RepID=A0A0D2PSQ9_HYPSF|nr:hypothetical protein HYPSUDRAFT_638326 [Hypholoma sublateritium FD-334 SS-4]
MATHSWNLSVEVRAKLIQCAFEAKKGSYSPYSHFPVGAALLAPDGRVIGGANVDCEPYGGTICAERTAIVKAVSEGTRSFVGLAVVTCVPPSHNDLICSFPEPHRPMPRLARPYVWTVIMVLITPHRNVPASISPCGICRQVLREFCPPDMPVLLVPGDYPQDTKDKENAAGKRELSEGGVREYTLGELIPDGFGPEQLAQLGAAR